MVIFFGAYELESSLRPIIKQDVHEMFLSLSGKSVILLYITTRNSFGGQFRNVEKDIMNSLKGESFLKRRSNRLFVSLMIRRIPTTSSRKASEREIEGFKCCCSKVTLG